MSNKTCGECKHYNIAMFHCEKFDCYAGEKDHCEDFEPKNPPTLFDRITTSLEILAAAVVYPDWAEYMGGDCWTSPFVGHYHTKEEAIAATVARLKETSDV